MTKGDIALNYFTSGYNCAQSVVCAFAPEMGLTTEMAAKIASGFGGGIGRTRSVCGAVTGMVIVLGALRGYNNVDETQKKTKIYKLVKKSLDEFKHRSDSILCDELLNLQKHTPYNPVAEARTPEYYKSRPCSVLVKDAADIVSDILQK